MADTNLKIGDILFLDGYGKSKGSKGNDHIIYNIENTNFGIKYYCIERTTLELSIKDYARSYTKKFGIGIYYLDDYNMTTFGIDNIKLFEMLEDAKVKKIQTDKLIALQAAENAKNIAAHNEYLSQFVVADRRKTTSIIKSHCKKTFNISKISVSTDVFSGGDSMDVEYTSPERIKELDSFIDSFQYGHFNGMEDIYEHNSNKNEIIIDGHILQTYKYVHVRHILGNGKPIKTDNMSVKVENCDLKIDVNGIEIVDYSEKSFAVIGETKKIKETLKGLGGSFNMRLSCGAGWIFPKSKLNNVKETLSI